MILDTLLVADAILDMPARSWVFKRGRVVARTCVTTAIYKDCGHAEHGALSALH
jgi:cytosine deaminase